MSLLCVRTGFGNFPARSASCAFLTFPRSFFISVPFLLMDLLAIEVHSFEKSSRLSFSMSATIFPRNVKSFRAINIALQNHRTLIVQLFCLLPVLLDAMSPTFLPGAACLDVDFDLPGWWFAPPNGWFSAFIAIALGYGYFLCLALIWCHLFPAFTNGLSFLPPPPAHPTVARLSGTSPIIFPEGIFK